MKNKNRIYLGILVFASMLNLLFMHYFFFFNGFLEWPWLYTVVINIFNVIFDISVLLCFFLFLLRWRLKPALLLTYILTFVWSFVNVMYGRFFYQYISLSAIGEVQALGDGLVINSVLAEIKWYDLFFIISLIFFIFLYRKTKKIVIEKIIVLKMLGIPVISLLMTIVTYSAYHFINPKYRNNWELYQFRIREFLYDSVGGGTPNMSHFHNGCLRVCAYELYDMLHMTVLSEEQRKEITSYYLDKSKRLTHHQSPKVQNLIFILMESFLSAPIDFKVDGKEVTPFLNQLKRESDVYYNGNMVSDIGGGESGDGQFIYMTGILPLHTKVTVSQLKNHTLPALPLVLKEYCGMNHSEIIYPTIPTLWQQADMNKIYGFKEAYSIEDIVGNPNNPVNDEEVFSFAINRLDDISEPFFSLILTLSTHSPYDHFLGEDLHLCDKSLPVKYKNYLNTCHYLDKQLSRYFTQLKVKGLYENSLIVLCADHHAHCGRFDMEGRISTYTPLFVVHGNINEAVWNGEFHQLDVYTTILDILNVDSKWKGLGHTLLIPDYSSSVSGDAIRLSEMIIEGDFFKGQE